MRSTWSSFCDAVARRVVFGVALCGLAAASCARTQAIPDGTGGAGGGGDVDAADDEMPPPMLGNGEDCSDATQCTSGACVDGVCCAGACPDICHSCALEGSKGVCALADVGTDPRDDCPDDGIATCGRDGVCDGSGACRHYPLGAICQPQSCNGSTRTNAFRCSDGACSPTSGQPCDPYQCNPAGNDCLTICQSNADCNAGSFCDNGSCGRKPLGAPCAVNDDCNSLICAQGVCCSSDCKGTCESCALPGAAGTCTAVPAGEDPLNQCTDSGRAVCGTDGTCDGKRACRLYLSGTVCQDPTCTSATTGTAQGRCDGMGTCAVGPPVVCGTCTSCVVNTAAAVCMPIAAGMAPVVASQCVNQGAASCGTDGTCNGAGACRVYPNGTVCAAGSCPTGAVLTSPRTCNAGTCGVSTTAPCPGGFLCDAANNMCKATCTVATSAADCVAPNVCTGTVCGSIRVQYQAGVATATTNSPHPAIKLINVGAATVNLSDLSIRYWFTNDGATSETAVIDFATNSANQQIQGNITTTFTPVTRQGADTFLQLGFTDVAANTMTGNGGTVVIDARFNSLNPAFGITYTQTNDYSFDATKTALADWTHVTVYRQGTLIWGIEPPPL
jgi:hypothetical protein